MCIMHEIEKVDAGNLPLDTSLQFINSHSWRQSTYESQFKCLIDNEGCPYLSGYEAPPLLSSHVCDWLRRAGHDLIGCLCCVEVWMEKGGRFGGLELNWVHYFPTVNFFSLRGNLLFPLLLPTRVPPNIFSWPQGAGREGTVGKSLNSLLPGC
jgi:hypothetical protein